ncbi:MDR family MFS transporter [Brevibacillus daliensis]|uniref:MDR family MFS transporter n=1 Tax=Brevibacillus daliensis TaxID=2892995 RepID=UPI001E51DB86|nr:MFS transporter [Brevibacillus daliensis]
MVSRLFASYPRELWILALGAIINVTGASFIWPLNNIYITTILDKPATIAGLVLMLHAGTGIIGSMVGGYLHDKVGGVKTILTGGIISTACVFSLAFFRDWYFYVFIMGVLGFGNALVLPVLNAMAGTIWPKGGRRAFNLVYLSQNLGVAVGSALGGLVAGVSFQLVFIVNGITNLIFLAIILIGLRNKMKRPSVENTSEPKTKQYDDVHVKVRGPSIWQSPYGISLMILCLGFAITWIPYAQWSTNFSSYMTDLGFKLSQYSLLWTINGALIILAQPLCSLLTQRVLKGLRSQMLTGLLIFAAGFGVLTINQSYMFFVIGMMIVTFGEMLLWPAIPAAAAELSTPGKEGFFQGAISGSATAGRMFGPVIGGFLYENFSPIIMIYAMVAICLIPMICYMVYDRPVYSKVQETLHR